jgi:predicted nuclease of predicted toxin-antitoxin system
MLKFIVDTQLPPLLSEMLRFKGFDAKHTTDYPNGSQMQDVEIVQIAIHENRIIISKDNDFLDIYILGKYHIRVLILEVGNIPNKELLKIISSQLNRIVELFDKSNLIILNKSNIIAY